MRYLKILALLGVSMLAATGANAQRVAIGIGVGGPGYYGVAPVCDYGYYNYYPYACAPYGYYGPDWFTGGIFIGAGPWFHGFHGHGDFHGHFDNHFHGGFNGHSNFNGGHAGFNNGRPGVSNGGRPGFNGGRPGNTVNRGGSFQRGPSGGSFRGGSSGGGFHGGGGASHGGGGGHGGGHR